jgi:hypothetical protein
MPLTPTDVVALWLGSTLRHASHHPRKPIGV